MKIFFRALLGIAGLIFSLTVAAQKNKERNATVYHQFNLRTSLGSWFDYDAGLMLGLGYRWSEQFSASFEPTWIFYNALATDGGATIIPSGLKIRADLKYHFPRRKKGSPDFFVAPEFHYKYTSSQLEGRFGINCQNGQCAYFQNAIYTDIKNEIGGLLKLGLITHFPFVNNSRWFLEIYNGLGVKQLKFRETELPVGGSFVNPPNRNFLSFGNINQRDVSTRPMLPFGVKLFFVL